ncbi:MAG: phosphatase [Bacteroidaceae bacterium]|nr:phosphatase [Bacteroidaceae bacterium]
MTPLLDLHTHSIASGHAYSTIQEMAQAAAQKGLQILGITEHAPSLPGACNAIYFRNLHVVPRQMYGVRLLLGAELNILDTHGTLDLDERHYRCCDLRIAGVHILCWQGGTRTQNTDGMLAAIHNPWTHIISHPGDGTADLLFEPIVLAARETQTLLEINSSSMIPLRKKEAARPNNLEILRLCRKYDVPIILGSDAHISFSIADYQYALPLLAETDFPDELVMNYWPERCMEYLHIDL